MFKKTISYEDFNGNQVEDDFYFNLTKAELMDMELGEEGGLHAALERISKSGDNGKILSTFKWIVSSAYGHKSDDGKRFVKSPEIKQELESSAAYAELYWELMTNEDAAAEFIKALVPKNLDEEMSKLQERNESLGKKLDSTPAQTKGMTQEDLEKVLADMKAKKSE